MRILITGASGFIGRNLSRYAVEKGHEVVGTYLNTAELSARDLPSTGVEWLHLDTQDAEQVAGIVNSVRPDGIFHLAAQAYAQIAWSKPADTFRTNVLGTIYLYEALRAHPPRAGTLLASSGASYGIPSRLPISEDIPLNPTNPYGVSKACQDMLSLQYSLNFGLRILRARLFGTTGPGKTGDALNDFARQVAAIEETGNPGKLKVGNLDTFRDISDVRDVVRALWLVFEKGAPEVPVNVAAGESYSIRRITEHLVRLAKVPLDVVQEPTLLRPTDEPDNRSDVTRLRELGFERRYALEQTIVDTLAFWRGERVA
jgi:GDP-4-dehydro-6-deoxy-D-mannose reductase